MKVFFLLFAFSCTSALPLKEVNENDTSTIIDELYRKKVESPRLDYMIKLQSTFADQSGKLKVGDLAAFPTSIFCLPDFDILYDRCRNETKSQSRCSSIYNFLFEWESGQDERSLPLEKAYVRMYMDVINRHVPIDRNASVSVSVKLTLTSTMANVSAGNESSFFSDEWYFLETLNVAVDADGWLEVDISEPLAMGWDPLLKSGTFDVSLKFDVDCNEQKKVPLKIINPATIEQLAKRERQLMFQPFLVVYIDDIQIKNVIEADQGPVLPEDKKIRTKRSDNVDQMCQLDDFFVVFSDLKLNIFYPNEVNIRRCDGNCSLEYANRFPSLATNHARLMINAHTLHNRDELPLVNDVEPQLPCCSPVVYSPIYLLSFVGRVLESRLYPDFIVKQCGCR